MTYGDAIPVTTLVKKMCDYMQSFTQYGGARPFGTALLIAGVDSDGVHLLKRSIRSLPIVSRRGNRSRKVYRNRPFRG